MESKQKGEKEDTLDTQFTLPTGGRNNRQPPLLPSKRSHSQSLVPNTNLAAVKVGAHLEALNVAKEEREERADGGRARHVRQYLQHLGIGEEGKPGEGNATVLT